MEIRSINQPTEAAAEHISKLIEGHNGNTLCFLAGGSATNIYNHLNLSIDAKGRTIFCMGDERWSREAEINNYLQLKISAFCFVQNHQVVDTSVKQNENQIQFTERINFAVEKIISDSGNLQIICVLGMGADGHTASIFPMDEESFSETYLTDSTYVPVRVSSLTIDSRASLTPRFILEQANHIVGYIVGDAKAAKLEELKNQEKNLNEMPAQIFKKHKSAVVFTDIQM